MNIHEFCAADHTAFPTPSESTGLTKREYFAALALQGILSHSDPVVFGKVAAEMAVKAADLLIEELNKEQS